MNSHKILKTLNEQEASAMKGESPRSSLDAKEKEPEARDYIFPPEILSSPNANFIPSSSGAYWSFGEFSKELQKPSPSEENLQHVALRKSGGPG